MAKRPAHHQPLGDEAPPPAPPEAFVTPESVMTPTPQATTNGSVPPPNIGSSGPAPLTALSDATAVITAQLALITAQNIQADDLTVAALPPDISSLPVNPNLPSITDTLAGASRALGAYINQLEALATLWPYTPPPA